MTEKIDPREAYSDDYDVDCSCNADKACAECVDGGIYEDRQLPPPPPFITLNWCVGSHQGCDCPDCHGER